MIGWPAQLKVEGKTISFQWACMAQVLNSQSKVGAGLVDPTLTGELWLTDRLWERSHCLQLCIHS